MHRHGYKGKKFSRQSQQRGALVSGLARSLVLEESIETTLPKAKTVSQFVEKLITKAKKGDIHNRRLIISRLGSIEAAHKLVDEIAPKLRGRSSGHLRLKKTSVRRGDNAQLAKISFVDDLTKKPVEVQKPVAKPKKDAPKAKPKTAKEKAK